MTGLKCLLMDKESSRKITSELYDKKGNVTLEKFSKMNGAICIEDKLFISYNLHHFMEKIYGC